MVAIKEKDRDRQAKVDETPVERVEYLNMFDHISVKSNDDNDELNPNAIPSLSSPKNNNLMEIQQRKVTQKEEQVRRVSEQ